MKKLSQLFAVAVAVAALFYTAEVKAQTAPRLGIGLNVGAATGSGYDYALGGDIRYQFNVGKQLSIPVTAGFTNLHGSDKINNVTYKRNYGYIPVKAGLKYFFNESGSGLYGLAEAGAGFGTSNGSGTAFVYSPAIGNSWSNGLDIGVKYEGLARNSNNTGYVGLRIAYGFGL